MADPTASARAAAAVAVAASTVGPPHPHPHAPTAMNLPSQPPPQQPAPPKPAKDNRDPHRPRRKKAKRACFACQRAHLTCGDERPCGRCIKRGLADACHDGVRKKAKYLHDAPVDALDSFHPQTPSQQQQQQQQHQISGLKRSSHDAGFSAPSAAAPDDYPSKQSQMGPPLLTDQLSVQPPPLSAQSPLSPSFALNNAAAAAAAATAGVPSSDPGAFPAFFDPSNPALFNFDLSSMNFDNRYGAMELSMLGHLTTGAGDTPSSSSDSHPSFAPPPSASFAADSPVAGQQQPFVFAESPDWQQQQHQPPDPSGFYDHGSGDTNSRSSSSSGSSLPRALVIESGPDSLGSPSSDGSPPVVLPYDDLAGRNNSLSVASGDPKQSLRLSSAVPATTAAAAVLSPRKRRRSPSDIYESVTRPYPYTSGFHSLTAYIQRRFPPRKTVQIAKALASIRPSLIATNRTLDQDDLVFMEKCFQRTLWEYEDFINVCGTPTLVCRRTGEVAAVGKEFCVLTGWSADVLLGRAPNLNTNTGYADGRDSNSGNGGDRLRPVLLAELMDDESVIEFYDDFARLAFGDSRGSVMSTCRLLKYMPRSDAVKAVDTADRDNDATPPHLHPADPEINPVLAADAPPDGSTSNISSTTTTTTTTSSSGNRNTNRNTSSKSGSSGGGGRNSDSPVSPGMMTTIGGRRGRRAAEAAGSGGGFGAGAAAGAGRGGSDGSGGSVVGQAAIGQLGKRDGKVECSYCWTVKRDVFDIPMLIVMNFLPNM